MYLKDCINRKIYAISAEKTSTSKNTLNHKANSTFNKVGSKVSLLSNSLSFVSSRLNNCVSQYNLPLINNSPVKENTISKDISVRLNQTISPHKKNKFRSSTEDELMRKSILLENDKIERYTMNKFCKLRSLKGIKNNVFCDLKRTLHIRISNLKTPRFLPIW